MRLILMCFSLFFLSVKQLHSQSDSVEALWLNDDSIRYDVILITPFDISNKPQLNGRYVRLLMSKKTQQMFLKKDSAFWVDHLTSGKSDWAANLILYYIYLKDASKLGYTYTTRSKWLATKPDDIGYWKKFLSSRHR